MVNLNASFSDFKKSPLGVSAFVIANMVVSSTLLFTTSLAHAEYYGPPQTFSGTTNEGGILQIVYRNPDSFQNMTDLTLTLIQPPGTPYHLEGYGFPGGHPGPTAEMNGDRTSLSFPSLSTFAGGLFSFGVEVAENTYNPEEGVFPYKNGTVKYTITPSFSKPFSPVPEPETYGMMLMGLGLMGFVARHRKNHQS